MPLYEFEFERRVIYTDSFRRVIEAAGVEEAEAVAEQHAGEYNNCFPDDAVTYFCEAEDLKVEFTEERSSADGFGKILHALAEDDSVIAN